MDTADGISRGTPPKDAPRVTDSKKFGRNRVSFRPLPFEDPATKLLQDGMDILQRGQARIERTLERIEYHVIERPTGGFSHCFPFNSPAAPCPPSGQQLMPSARSGQSRLGYQSSGGDSHGEVPSLLVVPPLDGGGPRRMSVISNGSNNASAMINSRSRGSFFGEDPSVRSGHSYNSNLYGSMMARAADGSYQYRKRKQLRNRFSELESFRMNGLDALLFEKAAIEKRIESLMSITPQYLQGRVEQTVSFAASKIIDQGEPVRQGILARIVDSSNLTTLTAFIIALNGFFMIATADYGMEEAEAGRNPEVRPAVMEIFEWFFIVYYTVECALKIWVHRCYFFTGCGWRWNWIDLFLVILAWAEAFIYIRMYGTVATRGDMDVSAAPSSSESAGGPNLSFLRSLRICKAAKIVRMIRVFNFVEELRLMLDCVIGSFFPLFWCCVLVFFVVYIFALFYVQAFTDYLTGEWANLDSEARETVSMSFGSKGPMSHAVLNTMVTLFGATTGGADWMDMFHMISETGSISRWLFILYIAFNVIVVWNIVTSTFVQKAVKLARPDIDTLIEEREQDDRACARELFAWLTRSMDDDQSGTISREEFAAIMSNRRFQKFLKVRELDLKDAETFFNMLAAIDGEGAEEILIERFVAGCVRMQGTAAAIDLQTLRFEMKRMHMRQNLESEECRSALKRLENTMQSALYSAGKANQGMSKQNYSSSPGCAGNSAEFIASVSAGARSHVKSAAPTNAADSPPAFSKGSVPGGLGLRSSSGDLAEASTTSETVASSPQSDPIHEPITMAKARQPPPEFSEVPAESAAPVGLSAGDVDRGDGMGSGSGTGSGSAIAAIGEAVVPSPTLPDDGAGGDRTTSAGTAKDGADAAAGTRAPQSSGKRSAGGRAKKRERRQSMDSLSRTSFSRQGSGDLLAVARPAGPSLTVQDNPVGDLSTTPSSGGAEALATQNAGHLSPRGRPVTHSRPRTNSRQALVNNQRRGSRSSKAALNL